MYLRAKTFTNKDGTARRYLYLVKGVREGGRVHQKTVAYLGRLDRLQQEGALDRLALSLARYTTEASSIQVTKKLLHDWTDEYDLSSVFEGVWEGLDLRKLFKDYVAQTVEGGQRLNIAHLVESPGTAKSEVVSEIAGRWGKITFAKEVVESIAVLAASEVKGLGKVRGIVTDATLPLAEQGMGEGNLKFSLRAAVQSGQPIHKIAQEVQQNVLDKMKEMTGLQVDRVDLHIQELELPTEKGKG